VLSRDTLQRNNKVFQATLLLLLLRRLAVHEVIETDGSLKEIVDATHNTEDTKGENPDTDDCHNAGLTTYEPSEKTEERGNDIDDQDGSGKLPRRNGRPEGAVGAGDEDEPVFRQGDLQEENLVEDTEILDDTAIFVPFGVAVVMDKHGSQSNPGTDRKNDTEKDGHPPKLGQIPLDRGLGVRGVIVRDGQGSDIGEDCDEDDEFQIETPVEDGDPKAQENLKVKGKSDTVNDVGVHAVENLAGSLESVDDSGQTGGQEDDISS